MLFSRALIAAAAVTATALATAAPALAGPPFICHAFELSGNPSLPWSTSAVGGWNNPDPTYDVSRLPADVPTLLTATLPVSARMETLRRATIYASRDRAVADALLKALEARAQANPADANAFMSGEAYSELFMSLVTNADAAAEFVNGIIPSGLEQEAAKIAATVPEEPVEDATGLTKTETPRVLSKQELSVMSAEELQSGLAAGRYKLS